MVESEKKDEDRKECEGDNTGGARDGDDLGVVADPAATLVVFVVASIGCWHNLFSFKSIYSIIISVAAPVIQTSCCCRVPRS